MLRINNTANDWHEFLIQLAAEASRDADALSPDLALHGMLHDLSLVAISYAGRLNIDRGAAIASETSLNQSAPADTQLVTEPSVAAPENAGPVSPSELPSWLVETIAMLRQRIEDLEARVAYLEDNQQKVSIAPSLSFMQDEAKIFDEDRSAWNTVDRARTALRGMVARQHEQRARIRQSLLARVTSLSTQVGDLTADERSELRQHSERAQELAEIDAIAGVMRDEIAGTDDLMALREFDVEKGWPQ